MRVQLTKITLAASILFALAFTFHACGSGDGDDSDPGNGGDGNLTATYSGISGGKTYTLKITKSISGAAYLPKSISSAAYSPKAGDSYILTVDGKTSTGTVSSFANGTFTLKPSNAEATFTATVSGDNLAEMSGTITWSDNTTEPAPSELTPAGLCDGFVNGTKKIHYGKEKEQFCDERDSKKYVYTKIGTQTWMAENLNYDVDSSECYGDSTSIGSESNCEIYGRLYNWTTAMNSICPSGWHIPSDEDWDKLIRYVDDNNVTSSDSSIAGKYLKATSGWNDYTGNSVGNGTDAHGFSALPGGYGNSGGNFSNVGNRGHWWSSSENNSDDAYYRGMYYFGDGVDWYNRDKSNLLSVRCVKN
jgi:uncharacterized protein (TIGR02145 family)